MSFFKNLFSRKQEEKLDPRDVNHAEIVFTDEAQEEGSFDDYNKEIKIIKDGFIIRSVKYSIHELKAIKKIEKLPIWDRTADTGDEFRFMEVEALSGEITITREE